MWSPRFRGGLVRAAASGGLARFVCTIVGFLTVPAVLAAGERNSDAYFRLGLGAAITGDTSFKDGDCASTDPAALFGCGPGSNGRPLGAYGDFGTSELIDFGFGAWFSDWLRAEATLSYRPGLAFTGHANFLTIPAKSQPVGADVESLSMMASGYLYPGPLFGIDSGRASPFLSAGLGVARNHTDKMVYRFPTLGADSVTITQPGSSTELAWSVGAGLDVDVARNLVASFAYRFSHLGDVRTNRGDARIVRSTFDVDIPVGKTRAPLVAHELFFSLRYQFPLR
ncbi:MAG: outer membrane beta-barrel protein [Hyphomicrobiales bacterium]|nr:outer membrane beta-barrel protein [Hyphomicrobiales bacterium]